MTVSQRSLTTSPYQLLECLRAILDWLPLPVVATDGPTHIVQYLNAACRQFLEQSAEGVVGRPLSGFGGEGPHVEQDQAIALLDLMYSTGAAESAVDLGCVFAKSDAVHLPCTVWPMLGDGEGPVGLLILVNPRISDIPPQPVDIATALELRTVNEQLLIAGLKAHEQAELEVSLRGEAEAAVAMRDGFMSIAAHELRTPVTAIKASAQLALRRLEEGTPNKEQIVRYQHGIVASANRLVVLINDLMDVSRMRSGDLQLTLSPLDFAALVGAVALRYAEAADERRPITVDRPAAPMMVMGEAGRLEQVLDNLLGNAVKYSPAGGAIGVSLVQTDTGVVLSVSDHGMGLTPGFEERIFEPFGRATNVTQEHLPGMGLGLHICRRIADAHGGRIWASSAGEGQGMTVSMWLPPA